ncbi:MAG: hypothetical protein ACK5ND_00965 [Bacteroides sp.]
MLPELHPYLDREYTLWYPYVYLAFLFVLIVGGLFLIYRLIKKYQSNRPLRKSVRLLSSSTRIEDDVDFLKFVALEMFSMTCFSFETPYSYPCEEWLKSISNGKVNFTVKPYRLLLDASLQPSESIPQLTNVERELIIKNAIQLIRRKYV